jgi:hypothetical protein
MLDAERVKLLFGPYRMSRCRVGRSWLRCAVRGQVKVVVRLESLWTNCPHRHAAERVVWHCYSTKEGVSNRKVALNAYLLY